jgi:hypothetical protein
MSKVMITEIIIELHSAQKGKGAFGQHILTALHGSATNPSILLVANTIVAENINLLQENNKDEVI